MTSKTDQPWSDSDNRIRQLDRNLRQLKEGRFKDYMAQHASRRPIPEKLGSALTFTQSKLCQEAWQDETFKIFVKRYGGMCELICNFIIAKDMMGQNTQGLPSLTDFNSQNFHVNRVAEGVKMSYHNPYEQNITLFNLKQNRIQQTHYLKTASIIQYILAFIFNIYPFSILSATTHLYDTGAVNRKALTDSLGAMADGSYIKFMAFNKSLKGISGHSMLIKKTGESYAFFDPNSGETQNLSFNGLCNKIDQYMSLSSYNNMALIDGNRYIHHVEHQASLAVDRPTRSPRAR